MLAAESVARCAALLADPSRAAMCLALLDGRAWTVGELARHAGVGPSTASEHVSRLVGGKLLAEERQGRHRYVRLADHDVAHLVEDLAGLAGEPVRPSSLRSVRAAAGLAAARTCYDHLAGRLGVAIFDALVRRELLSTSHGLALTPAGTAWFVDLGCDLAPGPGRRPVLRTCLDWTERRPHLAGRAGAALHQQLLARSWTARAAEHRAITVTPSGQRALSDLLGLDVASAEASDGGALPVPVRQRS